MHRCSGLHYVKGSLKALPLIPRGKSSGKGNAPCLAQVYNPISVNQSGQATRNILNLSCSDDDVSLSLGVNNYKNDHPLSYFAVGSDIVSTLNN